MKTLRLILVVFVLATTGCTGLFGEVPENENTRNGLALEVGPPSEVAVEEDFPVVLNLVDESGDILKREGVDLDLSLSEGEFASGDAQVSASSDETGTVEFSLNIEEARQGLVLTATSEHEDFANASLSTEPFDVIEFWLPCDDSEAFGGGDGSDDDPYRICTPEHLNEIHSGTNALESAFVVARDLNMVQVSDFNIIGDPDEPFEGQFDGRGFTIQNLKIESPDDDYVGIFGAVDENAVIEDIVLEDIEVSGANAVGGLAGANAGTITNCSATVEVDGKGGESNTTTGTNGVGGLVGSNSGTITNCSVEVDVYSEDRFAGGLAGTNRGDISGSNATGVEISGSDATGMVNCDGNYAGGLVGLNIGHIDGCSATVSTTGAEDVGGLVGANGHVIEDSYATGAVDGGRSVGGLVGSVYAQDSVPDLEVAVAESYATGDVTGSEGVGGLIGKCGGTIEDSYATGNVAGTRNVGGLVGEHSDTQTDIRWSVRRSYATGSVGPSPAATSSNRVGGLIGFARVVEIDASYATGAVEGANQIGGLVGRFFFGSIANSYATGSVDVDGIGNNLVGGGLVGKVGNIADFASAGTENSISSSYAAGEVTGDGENIGGLFGVVEEVVEDEVGELAPEITACYWDEETTNANQGVGTGSNDGVTGLDDGFDSTETFDEAWKFDDIWIIGEAPDGLQRPILWWQE